LNRYEDASKCLERAVAAVPDNDQYYLSLALVQLRAGDTENADRVSRRGLARIPNSGLLYWTAGIVAVVRGHDRDAENLLKKASELSPSREALAATLGVFYYEEGRYSDARDVLKKCEEMFPQGALDFQKIKAVLDAASSSGAPRPSDYIPPDARREFYELALMMRDQEQ
jgi:tetratricopeptide (TPR) repeat protein